MNIGELTNEELLKTYERLVKQLQRRFTDRDANYKEKVKEELIKRLGQ